MKTYTVDQAAQHLWNKLDFSSEQGCALWIGSGLSADYYASWEQTILSLCDACGVEPPDSGATSDVLLSKAEECKQASEERYHDTILRLFADPSTTGARQAYIYLWSLDQPVYLTTNYDPILYSFSYRPAITSHVYPYLPPESLGSGQTQVYYLHGLADRERDSRFVLSSSEFDEAYEDPGYLTAFLETLFRGYDVLFTGCRLSEPPLRGVLKKVDRIADSLDEIAGDYKKPTRMMLLPVPDADGRDEAVAEGQSLEKSRLETLDVEVLWYEPEHRDVHSELEGIFKKLCELNQGEEMTHRSAARL